MGEKGKRDKGAKEAKKQPKRTADEKRKAKQEKKNARG
jgi:hypothetical protein